MRPSGCCKLFDMNMLSSPDDGFKKLEYIIHKRDSEESFVTTEPEMNSYALITRSLTYTYAINCVPYLAIRTLQTFPKGNERQYPKTLNVIMSHMYVDSIPKSDQDQ